ncbi:uncharacterized protein LOC134842845 isoform X2 [Symsagittifera roscoffensis]|uniref:uncharacterized protein LOC134842845 isoform X2 n=1 Tax=Symsagittifera roscoffensis TaxID=84072 RepID=UPI00307B3562
MSISSLIVDESRHLAARNVQQPGCCGCKPDQRNLIVSSMLGFATLTSIVVAIYLLMNHRNEHAPSAGDYSRSEYAREDADNYGANEYAYDHAGGNVCHMH